MGGWTRVAPREHGDKAAIRARHKHQKVNPSATPMLDRALASVPTTFPTAWGIRVRVRVRVRVEVGQVAEATGLGY